MAEMHTLDELTDQLVLWLDQQAGVTDAERVESVFRDMDLPGHEFIGFRLDGIGISVELSFTQ